MRHVYLAATGQNRGKTTVALGLLDGFQRRGLSAGFFKPVGQRTVMEGGVPADEDAVLMRTVFDLGEPLDRMSPVHIPRGFTQSYIDGHVVEDLPARIRAAHASFARERDILLIEGTGHAGVGAVIGLSNAVVARLLGAPAVVVSEGGVGRPIDEIVLNAALFERHGVRVAGAIVNKVDLDAKPGLARTLERGLARHGVPLLGVLPYRPILSNPTLAMVLEGVHGETIHPGPDLDLVIGGVAIGAMEPDHMLQRIGPRSLVIVPGDREDVILTLTTAHLARRFKVANASEAARIAQIAAEATNERTASVDGHEGAAIGLVLTGGYRPRDAVVAAIRQADLFATLVREDTYVVASEVHDLLVKTHPADREKIETIKGLVAEHLDIQRILDVAEEIPAASAS
jgi:BioD-like phosphotransacetylase family protein